MHEHGNNDDIKELRKEVRDLDRWMVRIDEKLTGLARIEQRANEAHELADSADDKATEALTAVNRLEMSLKWSVGSLISIVVPLTIFVLTRVFS